MAQNYKKDRKRVNQNKPYKPSKRGAKTIRLPVEEIDWNSTVKDAVLFRQMLERLIGQHPVLFPQSIQAGFELHSVQYSKKLHLTYRRIRLRDGRLFSVVPGYVLPYMSGKCDDVHLGLLFKQHGAPNWLLSLAFGRDEMYWERLENALGRFSVVGTTVKRAESLPKDYACDEKVTWLNGQEVLVAMTSAQECVLGMAVSMGEDGASLKKAYGVFAKEARGVCPGFQVRSVNVDGYKPTQNAWLALFRRVVLIRCFLHGALKIRKWIKTDKIHCKALLDRVWEAYRAQCTEDFFAKMEELLEWGQQHDIHPNAKEQITKLYNRALEYELFYQYPFAYRTSNMVDRQMDAFDRYIYARRYFHGHRATAELKVRSWALIHNFAPFCPRRQLNKKKENFPAANCRAAELNKMTYHENWLQNLICSASTNGYKC